MAERSVGLGVLGVGLQGEAHVRTFKCVPGCEVVAVADVNAERAAEVARQYGVPHADDNLDELLANDAVEAVSIVLPDHLHREAGVRAAQAGKHLLMEKPLATTVADAEAIVAAAKAAGVKLMVNFSNRWQLAVKMLRERFSAGAFGKAVYAYTRLNNTIYVPTGMLKPWSSQTKLPFWLLSHTLDRVRYVWQADPVRVYAVQHSGVLTSMGFDTPDLYHATIEWDNGAIGTFESCWILPETMPSVVDSKMEFVFEKGAVHVDALAPDIQVVTPEKYSIPSIISYSLDGEPRGFVLEALRHFVDCVAHDRDPEPSGDDGLLMCRTSAAIVESAERRQPVEISGRCSS